MVNPLYFGHGFVIGRHIETNKFLLHERPTNEVFDGRPPSFDGLTDKSERQIVCRPPEWYLFPLVGPLWRLDSTTILYRSVPDLILLDRPLEPAVEAARILQFQLVGHHFGCEHGSMGRQTTFIEHPLNLFMLLYFLLLYLSAPWNQSLKLL